MTLPKMMACIVAFFALLSGILCCSGRVKPYPISLWARLFWLLNGVSKDWASSLRAGSGGTPSCSCLPGGQYEWGQLNKVSEGGPKVSWIKCLKGVRGFIICNDCYFLLWDQINAKGVLIGNGCWFLLWGKLKAWGSSSAMVAGSCCGTKSMPGGHHWQWLLVPAGEPGPAKVWA